MEKPVYSWNTAKTEAGYRWSVTAFSYGQASRTVEAGECDTRAKATLRARRAVMPYRRGTKEG